MPSLSTIRRICAAIDAVTLTFIAANLSKSRSKSDLVVFASESCYSESFPTISRCKAAAFRARLSTKAQKDISNDDSEGLGYAKTPVDEVKVSEPALLKLKAERDPEKLFQLFKANAENRIVVENRFAFEDTVARLGGARRFDLIEDILEQQKRLRQGRREGFIVRIIMLYGKVGMVDHAVKTFDEMHLFGCRRSVKSFNATLKVLSELRRVDVLHRFFDEVPLKSNILLDEISYNTVIKFLCETGSLQSAYLVMVRMEKEGMKPDVFTYSTLMSAFYKHRQFVIGDGLWNLMLRRSGLPNLTIFNVRIQSLINRRRGWEANSLVKMMYKRGVQPDELTYNLIIKGFCLMGKLEMAETVFHAMHGRGCKPNSRIYQTMVHYLCEGGKFELAFRFCKDSMEKNWFPNTDTTSKLLKGLMSITKDRNAREIMKLVSGRTPSYPPEQIKAFEEILYHIKYNKKQEHLIHKF